MNRHLYRSDDRMIAGVAGGVADYFDADPSLVRIIWAISIPFTGLATLLLYIVMAIVVPEEPGDWSFATPGAVPPSGWWPSSGAGAAGTGAPGTGPGTGAPVTGTAAAMSATGGTSESGGTPAEGASDTTSTWTATTEQPPAATGQPAPGFVPGGPTDWQTARRQERWQRRQERWDRRHERWDRRGNGTGALVFGLLLVVIGAAFLAHQVVPSIDFNQIWPVALIAIGVVFLVGSVTGRSGS